MSIALPSFKVCLVKQTQDGNFSHTDIALDDYIKDTAQGLVLYFYPKDDTPGCTIQAQDFSRDIKAYQDKGYEVIGVSRDGTKSHENFIKKHELGIALISDDDEKLCQHFDVIHEKTLYGKTSLGIVRSTFVFDKQGNLIHEMRNVTAKEHSDKLLELLDDK